MCEPRGLGVQQCCTGMEKRVVIVLNSLPVSIEYATLYAGEATALQAGMPAVQSVDLTFLYCRISIASTPRKPRRCRQGCLRSSPLAQSFLPRFHHRFFAHDFLRDLSITFRFWFAVV